MSNNPFDEVEAVVPQENFLDTFGVQGEHLLGEIPEEALAYAVRKATGKDLFMAHQGPEYQFTSHIALDSHNQAYLVTKNVAVELGSDAKKVTLTLCQNHKLETFINPVTAITPQNAKNSWIRSLHNAISEAQEGFIRISADQSRESYRFHKIARELPAPQWPDKPFSELLQEAFGDRIIKSMDHPVVQEIMEGLV